MPKLCRLPHKSSRGLGAEYLCRPEKQQPLLDFVARLLRKRKCQLKLEGFSHGFPGRSNVLRLSNLFRVIDHCICPSQKLEGKLRPYDLAYVHVMLNTFRSSSIVHGSWIKLCIIPREIEAQKRRVRRPSRCSPVPTSSMKSFRLTNKPAKKQQGRWIA